MNPELMSPTYCMQPLMSMQKNPGFFSNSWADGLFRQETSCEDFFISTIENTEELRHLNDDRFYLDEYLRTLAERKRILAKETSLAKLLRISEIADEAMYPHVKSDMQNIENLIKWKQCQDLKHKQFMLQEQARLDRNWDDLALMNRLKKETTNTNHIEQAAEQRKHVVGQRKDKYNRKLHVLKTVVKPVQKRTVRVKPRGNKPNCWHYTRGHCKRGNYCDFKHDRKNT